MLDPKGNYKLGLKSKLGLSAVPLTLNLFVVNSSEDGWWEAENAAGKQGVVPKTLLKVTTGSFDSFELVCVMI